MPYTSDTPKVRDKQETGYRNTEPDFGIFMLRVTGQLISRYIPTVSRMLEEVTLLHWILRSGDLKCGLLLRLSFDEV